jgi:hypothetical protein
MQQEFTACLAGTILGMPVRHRVPVVMALVAALAASGLLTAQAPTRIATTADALVASPFFFHGKQVAVRHALEQEGDLVRLAGTARPIFVYWRSRPDRSTGEIRGEFWDLGRFEEHDARFAGYDFRPILDAVSNGRWPPRERVYLILGATLVDSPLPQAPTLRALALAPEQYEGREVTLVGRFKGANLYGDLPQGVGRSKWDFILQSADASVWIANVRPRGRGFELDPTRRVGGGRWLQVTGTVRRDGTMVWIDGRALEAADAVDETPVEVAAPVVPKQPPPAVIFSSPVPDDFDVAREGPVRLQFSRDMTPESFRNAIRARYTAPDAPATPALTATYDGGTRAVRITFAEPLLRFMEVRVDLLEGITAIDGQPLQPWSLTFTTGG